MLAWLKVQIDKLHGGRQITESSNGLFRVHYFDGGKTTPMYWHTAKEYAQIFGGEIYHIKTGRKVTAYYSLNDLTG